MKGRKITKNVKALTTGKKIKKLWINQKLENCTDSCMNSMNLRNVLTICMDFNKLAWYLNNLAWISMNLYDIWTISYRFQCTFVIVHRKSLKNSPSSAIEEAVITLSSFVTLHWSFNVKKPFIQYYGWIWIFSYTKACSPCWAALYLVGLSF